MLANQLGSKPPSCKYCDERYFLEPCDTCRQALCQMHRWRVSDNKVLCLQKCLPAPAPSRLSAATKVRLWSFTFYLLAALLIFALYYLGKV